MSIGKGTKTFLSGEFVIGPADNRKKEGHLLELPYPRERVSEYFQVEFIPVQFDQVLDGCVAVRFPKCKIPLLKRDQA